MFIGVCRSFHRTMRAVRSGIDLERVDGPFIDVGLALSGASHPRVLRDSNGRDWVAKTKAGMRGQFLAEVISSLLGRQLGISSPDFAYCIEPHAWLLEWIDSASPWWEVWNSSVSNEAAIGAMLALDALMLNSDRSEENILLIPNGDKTWRLMAIDSGGHVAGDTSEFARRRDEICKVGVFPAGLPVVREHAMNCAMSAEKLDGLVLAALAAQACEVAHCGDSGLLLQTIQHRCRNAMKLVGDFISVLEGRPR